MPERSIPATLVALAMLIAACFSAQAYSGQALEKQARVSMSRATAIALRARPGVVTDRELEREGGGSGLRYSFDVKSRGILYEVGVDAITGRVLENDLESAHPD